MNTWCSPLVHSDPFVQATRSSWLEQQVEAEWLAAILCHWIQQRSWKRTSLYRSVFVSKWYDASFLTAEYSLQTFFLRNFVCTAPYVKYGRVPKNVELKQIVFHLIDFNLLSCGLSQVSKTIGQLPSGIVINICFIFKTSVFEKIPINFLIKNMQ